MKKNSKFNAVANIFIQIKKLTNVEAIQGKYGWRTHKLASIMSKLKSIGFVFTTKEIRINNQYIDFEYILEDISFDYTGDIIYYKEDLYIIIETRFIENNIIYTIKNKGTEEVKEIDIYDIIADKNKD